jgi:hypothetical protein
MRSLRQPGPLRHASFGKAVALSLRGDYCITVSSEGKRFVEWYDSLTFCWRTMGGETFMEQHVTEVLSRLGSEYHMDHKDWHPVAVRLDPPAEYECGDFRRNVARCALDYLARSTLEPLDGPQTDGTLQFAGDVTVDFNRGNLVNGKNKEYRSTRCTGKRYVEWACTDIEVRRRTTELCGQLNQFFDGGGTDLTPEMLDELQELASHDLPNVWRWGSESRRLPHRFSLGSAVCRRRACITPTLCPHAIM